MRAIVLRLSAVCAALFVLLAADASELVRYFADLPSGQDPATISRRIADQFLRAVPEDYHPVGYAGNAGYGQGCKVQYSVVSTWLNALRCARLTGDDCRARRLIARFDDFLPGGIKAKCCSRPWHVDDAIFGALPLEIFLTNSDERCRKLGLGYADAQWDAPCAESLAERHAASAEVQTNYFNAGYSVQTRLWIDDMYMITVLQSQAYRVTRDRKYIERAAKEMCLYLDRLQLKDGIAKGLFYHAPDAPYVWGRGDGWMAAGMALVLDFLPEDSPYRARVLSGYRLMMERLLAFQRPDGMWCQLVDRPDDPRNWPETSCSAMFAYAFVVGVRRGWLDASVYAPAARRAYLALCGKMDVYGNLADTCIGTGKKDDLEYYFARGKVNGDPHAQAPMLWLAAVLIEDGAGVVNGIHTPETSRLFEKRVDPVSGVVSYSLCFGDETDNRQSLYFVAKSMTDDGRFLVFNYTKGNERSPSGCGPRLTMVADLLKDEITCLESIKRGIPFVELKKNYLVFVSTNGFFRYDFAAPSVCRKLCDMPRELFALGKPRFLSTHLTLTRDRSRAFLDSCWVDGPKTNYVQGLVNLATGAYESWGKTDFYCNHGQMNPVRDDLALCAWEAANKTQDGLDYRKRTGIYPRMWLVYADGRRELVHARAENSATHEIWDDDGAGFSWCGRGVHHHDLATGRQECLIPGAIILTRHANLSPDERYIVYDEAPEAWWRGCKWRVGFWNRDTGKSVWIYTTRPALMPQNNESTLHPDPHPHFVCNASYVVSTANNADGHMDLYITPVDQLIQLTTSGR